ncbi:ABC transporter permease [Streptomyces sp. TP-A0874]|uniref:ABC transporter permease n=1 Tax=Streptomyces sp. TP-A0874 TaxID=549819 RepID=UPI000852FAC0|nr:ABC transporter permease [Streptomyces sp. TP-A0874]
MSEFLFAALLQTTPVLLAALAALFTMRANILNVAVEGMMLMAAFTAIAVGLMSGSMLLALLAAVGAGLLMALLFGVFTLGLNTNPLVAGLGINLLAGGITVFLLERVYDNPGGLRPDSFPELWKIEGAWLKAVPVIGPALNGQSVIVFLALLLVPVCSLVLYRTRFGYTLRAAGEDEHAAKAAGINVPRARLVSVLISGLLGGLAGAQLAMATLHFFLPDMTSGRGFLGLAAMLFGGATPGGSFAASALFGTAGAAADRLQGGAIPNQLVLAVPYIAAILALTAARMGLLQRLRAKRMRTT